MVAIEEENHGMADPILEEEAAGPYCFKGALNDLPRHQIHSSQNKQYD